ncbi:MAG: GTP-binding protein [Flavitalea sp.]
MKLYLLGGFLGSGKSTAIQEACVQYANDGIKVAVITNDQGERVVDSKIFENASIPFREVLGGCFCCNYYQLTGSISSLAAMNEYEIIFAESVGSCTDLVATIARPLNIEYPDIQICISVFADASLLYSVIAGNSCFLDETVQYIFKKQLEEADILVINKCDLLDSEQLTLIKKIVNADYSGKEILYQNSLDQKSIRNWLEVLQEPSFRGQRKALQLDYDIYAEGESKLAWMDQQFKITTTDGSAFASALVIVECIYEKLKIAGYPIGHLKFFVSDGSRSTKISYTTSDHPAEHNHTDFKDADSITVLMNARIQTIAERLEDLVVNAVQEFKQKSLVGISVEYSTAFRPGYPKPTYRLED